MSIDYVAEIQKIMPPPANPIDVDPAVLQRNLESLKLTSGLPEDYLRYAMIYGSGCPQLHDNDPEIGPRTWDMWSPARPTYPEIIARFYDAKNQFREAMETFDIPLGLYPEPGGLLPFGEDHSGFSFTWKTDGNPEEWKVVFIYAYDYDEYEIFDMGFSEFLFQLLTQQLSSKMIITDGNVTGISFSQRLYGM